MTYSRLTTILSMQLKTLVSIHLPEKSKLKQSLITVLVFEQDDEPLMLAFLA